ARPQTARESAANTTPPPSASSAVGRSRVPSSALAGNVVITASGNTNVNTTRRAPLKIVTGQRAKAKTEPKKYDRVATFTTQNAALTTRIQIEYRIITASPRKTAPTRRSPGEGQRPSWWNA